jgi:hypothetical protein
MINSLGLPVASVVPLLAVLVVMYCVVCCRYWLLR